MQEPHLPVFSSRADTIIEVFVDHGDLLLLHHPMALLLLLSAVVVRLRVLLVDVRGPLHKEGVEVVHPVGAKECNVEGGEKLLHSNTKFKSRQIVELWFSNVTAGQSFFPMAGVGKGRKNCTFLMSQTCRCMKANE